jgi:hypothetical protein
LTVAVGTAEGDRTIGSAVKTIEVVAVGSPLKGRNGAAIVVDSCGHKHVFKHNTGGGLRRILTDKERRRRDVCNILASRILSDVFGLPAVVYYDAVLLFPDGSTRAGVVSNYVDGLQLLEDVRAEDVVNRDDALMQVILLAWLGDMDRIDHPDNEAVDPDGRYIVLDFDFCFSLGVTTLGLPNASRRALERFVTRDALAPLLVRVMTLSDTRIHEMVNEIGSAWVRNWTPEQARDFSSILIHNRKLMGSVDAFLIYQAHGWRRAWVQFAFPKIFSFLFSKKIVRLIVTQGPFATLWVLIDSCLRFAGGPLILSSY